MRTLLLFLVVSCTACSSPNGAFDGGVAGQGGGAAGGGGGGGGAVDAATPRGEGEPCQVTADCESGLQCMTRITAAGAVSRCSSCSIAGETCGDGGRCLATLTNDGLTVRCSFGRPGEPCTANADCLSNDCMTVTTAGGTRSVCR